MSRVRRPAWGSILPVVTLLAGALFAASASTARGTGLREQGPTEITELIAAEQRRGRQQRAEYRRLRHEIDRISRATARHHARAKQARAGAGFTALGGPAVRRVGNTLILQGVVYSPPYTGNVTMKHATVPD